MLEVNQIVLKKMIIELIDIVKLVFSKKSLKCVLYVGEMKLKDSTLKRIICMTYTSRATNM